jgi:hypothetical protein
MLPILREETGCAGLSIGKENHPLAFDTNSYTEGRRRIRVLRKLRQAVPLGTGVVIDKVGRLSAVIS